MYSLTMGNSFHNAKALKARMMSAPDRSFTDFISDKFFRSLTSSTTYAGDGIWL